VLSYGLWHRQFGGDTNVIGRTISLDGTGYEIVGILPPGFKFTTSLDVLVPIAFTPADRESRAEELLVVGRLKSGATATQAQVELESHVAKPIRDQSSYHAKHEWKVFAQPLKDNLTADIRPMLVLLLSAVAMVLLIACVNVATLFLAAGIAREKEIAVRAALGAGRFRLVRQLLVEGLVLSFLGAAAGLILSKGLTVWIAGLIPESLVHNIAHWDHIQVDIHVLGFTLAATIASVMIFALIPALQISKSNPNQSLKENGNRSSDGVSQRRLRVLLVVGEIALATMLLAGAGLVFQGFLRVLRVDPGFDPDQLLTLQVMLPARKYPSLEKRQALLDELLDKAKALPGVSSVALTDNPPFHGGYMMGLSIEGRNDVADAHGAPGGISANYFETMKIPVLYGRAFTDRDTANSLPVAIIDEKLARRFWPNQSPIGKRLSIGFEQSSGNPAWREIVGVVGEIKNRGLSTDPKEQYYFPASQMGAGIMHLIDNTYLMIRTKGSPDAIIPALRKQIRAIDPDQPISYVTTVDAQLDELLAPQRLQSLLVGAFAILALGLAGVGLYGVVAYTTRQRTREFGIRLALGARRNQLVWLVLRQGMRMVAIGLVVGLAGACALGPVLSGFIHEVQPRDLRVICSAALILAAVALLACLFPARRATRIDPMTALRDE
ncbi:MAG TPA: ABC transporter permease, partial [Verrucomicrobiae bacterium]|nr:ABC transporter permease [Verrucomicrobiae bacterium]